MARMIDADVASKRFRGWLEGPHEASEYNSGFDDAIYRVLDVIDHMPTLTQPNEPLALDDLRKIDTVTPLWVHDLSWGRHKPRLMLVRYVASRYWSCVDFDGFEIVKADDYGSRYLIYRRPPEGEEEEKRVVEITENL